ncbi:MAG: RagB/SusD family nutrient uptake outer membrane protein [Alistipes finegoldii]
MIRLGEIYLIYAEACMNLGQANTALPKLKELTDRAGVSAPRRSRPTTCSRSVPAS